MKANFGQIKIIHVLKGLLKLSDDDYRVMLSSYSKSSSKDLEMNQAIEFIQTLERLAEKAGVWEKKVPQESRPSHINRPGYANWNQIKKIHALWNQVSRQPDAKSKKAALNTFINKHFKIQFIEWLPIELVGKVIKTLEVMKKQAIEKGEIKCSA